MVNGQWVVKDREILNLDLEAVQAAHRQAAKALLAA